MKYLLVFTLVAITAHAQRTVPQWIDVHSGTYTPQHLTGVVSIPDSRYGAVISSNLGFDSTNIVQCTDDGGATWRNVRYARCYNVDPVTFKPLEGWWKEQYFQAVARPSKDTIVVVVVRRPKNDPDGSPIYGTLIPHLERSTDGGATWANVTIGAMPLASWFYSHLSMDHRTVGYLFSGDQADTTIARLYRTTDAGASWTATPFNDFGFTPTGMRSKGADSVYLWNSEQMILSTDGGATFADVALPNGTSDVQWMMPNVAVAVGGVATGEGHQQKAFVKVTEDGGTKWRTLLDSIVDGGEFVGVAVDAKGNILALGRDRVMHRDNVKRVWESARFPFGTSKSNAAAIRWTQGGHAVAILLDDVIYYTGKRELLAPTASFTPMGDKHVLEWTSESTDVRYHVQIASKPSKDLLGFDHAIFDRQDAMLLDTIVSNASSPQITLPQGHDVYGRVRSYSAADSSGWSEEAVTRTPAAPPPPLLDRPVLITPDNGIVSTGTLMVFTWSGDDRTQTYDLMLTTRGTYDGAFDDSVAQNVHGLTGTVTSKTLTVGKTYWWYVVANAPGFGPTPSMSFRSFRIDATSSVDDLVIGTAESLVAVYDLQGCAVEQPFDIYALPAGQWFLHLRSGAHERYVRLIVP
ncbi:MAG: hypothetical protein JSS89_09400 [Bacteroidetes bacterium]|nr:hypothetical protein [Bacteroidota bacterium]